MQLLFRSFFIICLALPLAVIASGCSNDEPISADRSGLRPDEETDDAPSGTPGEDERSGTGGAPDDRDIAGDPPDDSLFPTRNGDPDATNREENGLPPTVAPASPNLADIEVPEVPAGSPAELKQFLDEIDGKLAKLSSDARSGLIGRESGQVLMEKLSGLLEVRLAAAEKISDHPEATAEQRKAAADAIFDSLDSLEQLGQPEMAERADALAAKLAQDEDPQVRRVATGVLLDRDVDALRSGEAEAADTKKLMEHVKVVFDGQPDDVSMRRFMSGQLAAQQLLRSQQPEQAVELMRVMGRHFVKADQPQLAQAGQDLLDQAKIIRLDDAMRRVMGEKEGAAKQLLQIGQDLLADEEVDAQTMRMVAFAASTLREDHPQVHDELSNAVVAAVEAQMADGELPADQLMELANVAGELGEGYADLEKRLSDAVLAKVNQKLVGESLSGETVQDVFTGVALQAEYAGNLELARQVLQPISEALAKVEAPESALREQIAAARTRIGLVGEPLIVEGQRPSGKPLDWSKYQGKVVLVHFWSLNSRASMADIPNIMDNYEEYQDQGFEVVSVNIDEDPTRVSEFFAARGEMPWPTVLSSDPEATGTNSPMAQKCGVTSLPFAVLIGRNGKVSAIHVRGPELGARLGEIFGDEETPSEESEDGNGGDGPPADEGDAGGDAREEEKPPTSDDGTSQSPEGRDASKQEDELAPEDEAPAESEEVNEPAEATP